MAWSGQFSDFDNFVLPNARGNIQDSKPRSTKPHNIQKESVNNTDIFPLACFNAILFAFICFLYLNQTTPSI
jgi:hypothetical protein